MARKGQKKKKSGGGKKKKPPKKGKGEKEKKRKEKGTDQRNWPMGGHFGPIHEIQEHDFVGWCTGGCWVTEATFPKQFQLQFLLADMKLTKYLHPRIAFPKQFQQLAVGYFYGYYLVISYSQMHGSNESKISI